MDILSLFPHKSFRSFQAETIQQIKECFDRGINNVILEAPTGSGKSSQALTLGLYYGSSYLLTSQKILQEQYIKDYGSHGMALLKGRSNYECMFYGAGFDCKEGCEKMTMRCPHKQICNYEVAKKTALASPVALMNYSYFFSALEYTDIIQKRELLICDETHSLENDLLRFVEFSFSDFILSKLGVTSKIPTYETTNEYVYWLQDILDKTNSLVEELKSKLENATGQVQMPFDFAESLFDIAASATETKTETSDRIQKMRTEFDLLKGLQTKINRFLITFGKVEWIDDLVYNPVLKRKTLTFKPLKVNEFTKKYILDVSDRRLFMSATVLSKKNMCSILGVEQDSCEFIRVPSTFPTDKMPIYMTNSGKMDMKTIDITLPKIVEDVDKMMELHEFDKGIIHAHTFKIAEYIRLNSKYADRLMTHDSKNREAKLEEFKSSKEPMVLISPSMTDGVDLKDDLARFVCIVKIPYLFLGDKQIKRRMEVDPDWYRWKAALTLVQAAGRGMRHEDDSCTIYIMDSGIKWFIKQNREYFPKHFIDSIQN